MRTSERKLEISEKTRKISCAYSLEKLSYAARVKKKKGAILIELQGMPGHAELLRERSAGRAGKKRAREDMKEGTPTPAFRKRAAQYDLE